MAPEKSGSEKYTLCSLASLNSVSAKEKVQKENEKNIDKNKILKRNFDIKFLSLNTNMT
jgi:hypothetical protein